MYKVIAVMLACVIAALVAGPVQATTITSSEFSLGYGFSGGSWNTSEADSTSSNTATTDGVFSFVPTVTGLKDTDGGPTFVGRVLGTSTGPTQVGYVENGAGFGASIVGSVVAPLDAAPDPNYQTTLEITSIRIWAHSWQTPAVAALNFTESTPSNTGVSATITPGTGDIGDRNAYVQLTWDPTDVAVSGLSSTRDFGLAYVGGTREIALDGFEVVGKVHLSYNAVPEPSTLVLLTAGLLGLLAYAWRKLK